MVKGIVVYFLLVFCLLTKDGLSFALNVLDEKSRVSLEMNFEDSMEEDVFDLMVNPAFPSSFPAKETVSEKPTRATVRAILCRKEDFIAIYLIQVYGKVSFVQNFITTFLQKNQ